MDFTLFNSGLLLKNTGLRNTLNLGGKILSGNGIFGISIEHPRGGSRTEIVFDTLRGNLSKSIRTGSHAAN